MSTITRRKALAVLAGLGVSAVGLGLVGACGWGATSYPATSHPSTRIPLLGYLGVGPLEFVWDEFRKGMSDLGWVEGQDFTADEGFSPDRADLREIATRQVRRPVDLLVASGTIAAQVAKQATSSIPIVMFGVASDPVELGLVASLTRPGGNVTGLTTAAPQMSGKRLELLAGLVPGCSRVAALLTPGNPSRAFLLRETQVAADALGVQIRILDVDSPEQIEAAFEAARAWPADGLVVLADARLTTMLPIVIEAASRNRLPAVYYGSNDVRAGGLVSYGDRQADRYRRAAYFVDKILRGAKPADLPVQQPTDFELVVNRRTAQVLGITIPAHVAAHVTEWIE